MKRFDYNYVNKEYRERKDAKEKNEDKFIEIIEHFMDYAAFGVDQEQYAKDCKLLEEINDVFTKSPFVHRFGSKKVKNLFGSPDIEFIVRTISLILKTGENDCLYVNNLNPYIKKALEKRGFKISGENVIIWE